MIAIPAHEEKIRRRKDGDRDPGIGEATRKRRDFFRRQERQLRHMSHHDASATLELLRELEHEIDVHVVGRGADVEMYIDVNIEFSRELKNALDLARFAGIVTRRATEHPRA